MRAEDAINRIYRQRDRLRLEELKARKRFRLWKIGKQIKPDDAWYAVHVFVSSLIFENADPKPAGLYSEWIDEEFYYAETWILEESWKGTAYEQFHDLLHKATYGEKESREEGWNQLKQICDIDFSYELPTDPKQLTFYIQSAKMYMRQYGDLRRIETNIDGIIRFMREFQRLPTPEELPLE